MNKVKQKEKGDDDRKDKKIYFPTSFNAMLNHLFLRMQHDNFIQEIAKPEDHEILSVNGLFEDLERYIEIFSLDHLCAFQDEDEGAPKIVETRKKVEVGVKQRPSICFLIENMDKPKEEKQENLAKD